VSWCSGWRGPGTVGGFGRCSWTGSRSGYGNGDWIHVVRCGARWQCDCCLPGDGADAMTWAPCVVTFCLYCAALGPMQATFCKKKKTEARLEANVCPLNFILPSYFNCGLINCFRHICSFILFKIYFYKIIYFIMIYFITKEI
jgi:hypothetical protein